MRWKFGSTEMFKSLNNLNLHIVNILGLAIFIAIIIFPVVFAANVLKFEKDQQTAVLGINISTNNRSLKIEPEHQKLEFNQNIKIKYLSYDQLLIYNQAIKISNTGNAAAKVAIVTETASPEIFFGTYNQLSGLKVENILPGETKSINIIAKPQNSPQAKENVLEFKLVNL